MAKGKKRTRGPKIETRQIAESVETETKMTTVRAAASRAGLPLPTTWADMMGLIMKVGAPMVMLAAAMYWFATRLDTKLDAHIAESAKVLSVQTQQLDVLWQMASSSQRMCINLAKVAKTDPIECTLVVRPNDQR